MTRFLILHPTHDPLLGESLGGTARRLQRAMGEFVAGAGREAELLSVTSSDEAWEAGWVSETTASAANGSGVADPHAVRGHLVRGHMARRLAETHEFDAMLAPSLVVRWARIEVMMAKWDGIRREIPVVYPNGNPGIYSSDSIMIGTGMHRALSVALSAYAPDGERIFENIRGLELLDEMRIEGMEFSMVIRPDLGQDSEVLARAVASVLDPYLVTP